MSTIVSILQQLSRPYTHAPSWSRDFHCFWGMRFCSCPRIRDFWYFATVVDAPRADSICNNPIPEWQSRIGMCWSFYERSDAVCTTVFGIDFFARIFGPTGAWSRVWREVVTCMSSRQRRWLDDSIPSARLFRTQISNPSKSQITFLFRFTPKMAIERVFWIRITIPELD